MCVDETASVWHILPRKVRGSNRGLQKTGQLSRLRITEFRNLISPPCRNKKAGLRQQVPTLTPVCHPCVLTKPPGDVVFRFLLGWICEDVGRWTVLNQIAFEEEGGPVANTRRLLHVVSHNHDCVLRTKFTN